MRLKKQMTKQAQKIDDYFHGRQEVPVAEEYERYILRLARKERYKTNAMLRWHGRKLTGLRGER